MVTIQISQYNNKTYIWISILKEPNPYYSLYIRIYRYNIHIYIYYNTPPEHNMIIPYIWISITTWWPVVKSWGPCRASVPQYFEHPAWGMSMRWLEKGDSMGIFIGIWYIYIYMYIYIYITYLYIYIYMYIWI